LTPRPILLAPLLLLCSCHVLPEQAPAAQLHDFGPPSALPAGAARSQAVVTRVAAPPWVSTAEVHYRFLFDDPTRLRSYAATQWVAPPPVLLEQRLREAVPAATAEDGAPRGTIYCEARLVTFEQQFRSPGSAEVVLRLEVTGRHAAEGPAFARTVLTLRRACRPDVHGAVSGLAALADEAIVRLREWLVQVGAAASPTTHDEASGG